MYIGGVYITYSELFDRRPAWEEVVGILASMDRLNTALLLSRVNTHLRHAFQEPERKNLRWCQMFLVRNFIDDSTWRRLQERLPLAKPEEWLLFHPLQILNLLRICFANSIESETKRPDENQELRYQLGAAGLMISDLILTKEEKLGIATGTEDERRVQLMSQLLPAFELLNAAKPRHLMLRSNVLFRILLGDANVRNDIAEKCRGFDIQQRFKQVTGIPLSRWLGLVFANYAYYMARTKDDLVEHPEYFVINRQSFISQSGVTQTEMDAYLATLSTSMEDLSRVLALQRPADPRFDFIPFRTWPLYLLKDGNFACVDPTFLIDKYCRVAEPNSKRLNLS